VRFNSEPKRRGPNRPEFPKCFRTLVVKIEKTNSNSLLRVEYLYSTLRSWLRNQFFSQKNLFFLTHGGKHTFEILIMSRGRVMAVLLTLQMAGQGAAVPPVGRWARPGDAFSSADAAIDSCVALATSNCSHSQKSARPSIFSIFTK
jgi:hypothetical protein